MKERIRKSIILLIVSIGFIALAFVLNLVRLGYEDRLPEQKAADNWGAGESYSLISAFFSKNDTMTKNQADYIAQEINSALISDSIAASEEVPDMWTYAYSAEENVSVSNGDATVTAVATVFAGDFFYIHDYEFVYGWHLKDDASVTNFAVIDEVMAWQIFGSSNVCGMEMTINEEPYTICGVLRQSYEQEWSSIYGEKPRVFILYSSTGARDLYSDVEVVELLLPNPISEYAENLAKGAISGSAEIVETSEKFSFLTLLKRIPELYRMGVREKEISYPYWENYSILMEVKSVKMLLCQLILAGVGGLLFLTSVIIAIKSIGKRMKTFVLFALVIFSAGTMSGCGKEEIPEKVAVEHVYRPKFIDIPEEMNYANNIIYTEDRIYISGVVYDEQWNATNMLISMDMDGENLQECKVPEVDNTGYTDSIFILDNNIKAMKIVFYSYDEITYESSESHQVLYFDEEGGILNEIELTPVIDSMWTEEDYKYLERFDMDGEGNMYIYANGTICVINAKGEEIYRGKFDLSDNAYVEKMVVKSSGGMDIFYNVWSDTESNSYYRTVDIVNGKLGEEKEVPKAIENNMYNLFADSDGNYYYSDNLGVYTINMETGEKQEVLNWLNSDISENVNNMTALSEDTFVARTYDYTNNYKEQIMFLTKVPDDEVVPKYVIELAGVYVSSDIKNAAVRFNRNSNDYRISITDYSVYCTDDDWELGYTMLNNDIMLGNIPDILCVPYNVQLENYVSKGLFADLNEYMINDESFNRDEYLTNIFEAYEVDGCLYELVTEFNIVTLAGKTKNLNGMTGWTMEEFYKFAEQLPEDVQLLFDTTRDAFVSMALMYCYEDFVNMDTGECEFDGEAFKKLLEFAKGLSTTYMWEEENSSGGYDASFWEEYDKFLINDKAILQNMYIGSFSSYLSTINYTFCDEITMIGYPASDRKGTVIGESGSRLAMSAKSGVKDGVWEVFKYFLSEDYQDSLDWSFPVKISSLEKMAQEELEQAQKRSDMDYGYDIMGEVDVYYGESTDVRVLTQEDVDTIMGLIKSLNRISKNDQELTAIITEEIAPYFDNKKSVDSVADIIQSRAQIFIYQRR